jgi:hypothetical protein
MALLTMPARAQTAVPGQQPWQTLPKMDRSETPTEHPAVKADEKAYKSALDAIPKPKETYDPWRNVRAAPPSK